MPGIDRDRALGAPSDGSPTPFPPIRVKGFFFKRKSCTQCRAKLLKDLDACPYCYERYAKAEKNSAAGYRTQAMRIGDDSMKLLGWLVPIRGAERSKLYVLAPQNIIGSDPACTIVLSDPYISARHIEIVEHGGAWLLRHRGSSNGTLVNDQQIQAEHELVDNDFIGIGNTVIKFKCFESWYVYPR